MSDTSHDLLARLTPEGAAVLSGPGTLREKWGRLCDGDKDVLEAALAAAGNELKRVRELAAKVGLIKEPQFNPQRDVGDQAAVQTPGE